MARSADTGARPEAGRDVPHGAGDVLLLLADRGDVVQLVRKRVSVATAEPYATSAPTPQALRLALGSADLDSLRQALGEVRDAVEADPYC
jgi:hypothetical protein